MNVYYATKMMILSAITVEYLEKVERTVDWMFENGELTARQLANLDSFIARQYDLITRNQ